MTGLEAINANNGWAISAVGISIVFTGLTLLSLAISQLHKVLDMWENRDVYLDRLKNYWKKPEVSTTVDTDTDEAAGVRMDIAEAARHYRLLANLIGEPFALPKMINIAEKRGLYRPYSVVNALLKAKIIVPDGRGYFLFKKQVSK